MEYTAAAAAVVVVVEGRNQRLYSVITVFDVYSYMMRMMMM